MGVFMVYCLVLSVGAGDGQNLVDYAQGAYRESWLRHPVFGDPSFDTFQHAANNPVLRGSPPYNWPVNGYLFTDPVSGRWYLYVGHYATGYAIKPGEPSYCTVFRSPDEGKTWEHLGPIFPKEPFVFEGEVSPTTHAPDVQVTYADGRYHLCYDWATDNTTWQNAATPASDSNSGAGYAWADRPEGPFTRAMQPICSTRNQAVLVGKYRRLYASSLIRREKDWLVLTLTDSGAYFGWALVGMTAAAPEGPYTPAKLLLHPELDRFHPPLLEFFPSFVHEGYVYCPATSVAMNRNYQGVFRAPVERAMAPEAWEICQHGSVWHAEPVEHEYAGIWGQTFGGSVTDSVLRVMFPSRDSKGDGTINVAARRWDTPYRDKGFVFSAHEGPSLTLLKVRGPAKRIEVECERKGVLTVAWNHAGPLGPDYPRSGAALHPFAMTRYTGLELSEAEWALVQVDAHGARKEFAKGAYPASGGGRFALSWIGEDRAALTFGAETAWSGSLPNGPGSIGLLAAPYSHAAVSQFAVEGLTQPARMDLLYTEAILDAAQNLADWEECKDDKSRVPASRVPARFRFGVGAVSKHPDAHVKWNVEGRQFAIWAPKGPDFGRAEVIVDGESAGIIDFQAAESVPSAPVFSRDRLEGPPYHAVRIQGRSGRFPVDSIEVTQ